MDSLVKKPKDKQLRDHMQRLHKDMPAALLRSGKLQTDDNAAVAAPFTVPGAAEVTQEGACDGRAATAVRLLLPAQTPPLPQLPSDAPYAYRSWQLLVYLLSSCIDPKAAVTTAPTRTAIERPLARLPDLQSSYLILLAHEPGQTRQRWSSNACHTAQDHFNAFYFYYCLL